MDLTFLGRHNHLYLIEILAQDRIKQERAAEQGKNSGQGWHPSEAGRKKGECKPPELSKTPEPLATRLPVDMI